jgi:hypothetical protein
MAGAILRAGDRVHRREDRTEPAGVIECFRWRQGEPFYKVRWPHGRRTEHVAQELIHAKWVGREGLSYTSGMRGTE